MCVVVDTNSRARFLDETDAPAALLHGWLNERRGKLLRAESGRWQMEHLASSGDWRKKVREYSGIGIIKTISDADIQSSMRLLPDKTKSGEKDRHVLALALAGGARLLYSADDKLRDDFKSVVGGGKIYPGAGGDAEKNPRNTLRRCRELLDEGGLCDHGAD